MPVAVTDKCDDSVERIKNCVEINTLVGIETYTHRIDRDPRDPLLYILAGKHPHGHYAKSGCKRIGNRDSAVGKVAQTTVQHSPERHEHDYTRNKPEAGNMCHRQIFPRRFLSIATSGPHKIAVNRDQEIIYVYRKIGVKAFVEINPHRDRGHHY